jgi:hypothetical protein
MTRTEKALLALWVLLFLAVTIAFLPNTHHLRFYVKESRPITIIEYIRNVILSIFL